MLVRPSVVTGIARVHQIIHGHATAFRSAKIGHLHDWWCRACRGGAPPAKRDFDITEHAAIVDDVFLIQVLADGGFVTRIIGEEASHRVEPGRRNHRIVAADPDPNRRSLFGLYTQVVATRRPVLCHGSIGFANRPTRTFEGLDCPLAAEDGTIGWIVSVLDVVAEAAEDGGAVFLSNCS